ncbi:hypothetical protein [Streptomyces synnematoformans]|uniref:DUF2812 domain-containing protein n=1 Tax=Streptomyces synnematoformans TaxID=415721 RepID=A0ABN2X861_9ACTN
MEAAEIIAYFDGRPAFTLYISNRDSFEIPLMIDLAYEFGYVFRFAYPGRWTQRLIFERDDGEQARARAWWSVYHYRRYGTWGRPQPRVPLPAHMGPRIDPFEAAKARHALGMHLNMSWRGGIIAQIGALLVVAVWRLHDEPAILISVVSVGVALATLFALRVRFPSKRVRRHQRTVATFELQQAVERGFIPPPPSGSPGG